MLHSILHSSHTIIVCNWVKRIPVKKNCREWREWQKFLFYLIFNKWKLIFFSVMIYAFSQIYSYRCHHNSKFKVNYSIFLYFLLSSSNFFNCCKALNHGCAIFVYALNENSRRVMIGWQLYMFPSKTKWVTNKMLMGQTQAFNYRSKTGRRNKVCRTHREMTHCFWLTLPWHVIG